MTISKLFCCFFTENHKKKKPLLNDDSKNYKLIDRYKQLDATFFTLTTLSLFDLKKVVKEFKENLNHYQDINSDSLSILLGHTSHKYSPTQIREAYQNIRPLLAYIRQKGLEDSRKDEQYAPRNLFRVDSIQP